MDKHHYDLLGTGRIIIQERDTTSIQQNSEIFAAIEHLSLADQEALYAVTYPHRRDPMYPSVNRLAAKTGLTAKQIKLRGKIVLEELARQFGC